MLCCCETEVLDSDGDVDIAMMFAIGTYPLLVVQDGCHDDGGSRSKPLATVTLAEFLKVGLVLNHTETPGLTIHCRWCHAYTFEHIVQFLFFNCLVLIVAAAVTVLRKF